MGLIELSQKLKKVGYEWAHRVILSTLCEHPTANTVLLLSGGVAVRSGSVVRCLAAAIHSTLPPALPWDQSLAQSPSRTID